MRIGPSVKLVRTSVQKGQINSLSSVYIDYENNK